MAAVWRSLRLQDLDFDENNSKLYKVKERRPLRTTFDSFDTRIKKYIAAEKPIDYLLMVSHGAIWRRF
jgi:hypothetical protein